jgi:hypothetical protein
MIGKPARPVPGQIWLRPAVGWQEALLRLFLVLVGLAAVWAGLATSAAVPDVVPASAPASEFSAERAMQDLAVVAAESHPIGSPRQAAVRDYLVAQIRALGFTPEIQHATLTRWGPGPGLVWTTAVDNVLVRVPGTDNSRAIVVEGHYDSVATTPGATDCGACAVTVLEALRAIAAGPPLQNDVIFLFADGEEVFIAGATAFMQQHPWAKDVGLTLVFEGMGTDGASMLYASSPESAWWTGQALRAAPRPLGYSFLNDLMWKLARNSGSDLDAFIADGQAGMAFINLSLDSAPAYHTFADNIQNLDPRSLQHHGSYAVSLVRHFGNLRLDAAPRMANAVYFPIFPGVMAHYSGALARLLAYLALLSFLAVVAIGLLRRRLSIAGVLSGSVLFLLNLIAAVVLATVVWMLIRRVNPDLHTFTFGGRYGAPYYLMAFMALTVAVVSALHLVWRRWVGLYALTIGALAWWTALAVLTGLALPGFSYMFAWPLLAALAVLGWSFAQPEPARRPRAQPLAWSFPAVVGLALLVPVVSFVFFFASRLEGILGAPLAAVPVPLAVLLIGLLLPAIELLVAGRWRWLPVAAAVVFVALLALATNQSRFTAQHPQANTVTYWLDADRGQARWITAHDSPVGGRVEAELDDWTRQFFPNGGRETTFKPFLNGLVDRAYPALETAAPIAALPGSEVTLLADTTSGATRHVRLRITAPQGVLDSQIIVKMGGPIQALAANDTALEMAGQPMEMVQISALGRHADGVTLDVAAAAGPVTVKVQDRRLGLPAIPSLTISPRPAWMVPAPFNDVADSTIVSNVLTFGD